MACLLRLLPDDCTAAELRFLDEAGTSLEKTLRISWVDDDLSIVMDGYRLDRDDNRLRRRSILDLDVSTRECSRRHDLDDCGSL
jgi:hypothetical protein